MSSQLKYLNTKEVSDIFSCSQKNIQKLIRESKLTPINPNHSKGYLFESTYIYSELKKRKEAQNA